MVLCYVENNEKAIDRDAKKDSTVSKYKLIMQGSFKWDSS